MRLINFNPQILRNQLERNNQKGTVGYLYLGNKVAPNIPNCINFGLIKNYNFIPMAGMSKADCMCDYWFNTFKMGTVQLELDAKRDAKVANNLTRCFSFVFTHDIDANGNIKHDNFNLALNYDQLKETYLIAAGAQPDGTIVGLFRTTYDAVYVVNGVPHSARTGQPMKLRGDVNSFVGRNTKSVDNDKGNLLPYFIEQFVEVGGHFAM